MVNVNSEVVGMQTIEENQKRYMKGMGTTGSFFIIPGKYSYNNNIYMCEGYATGCSIHQATDSMVVVAFDAGNLLAVANLFSKNRKLNEDKNILVCADNDHTKKRNRGIDVAKEIKDMCYLDFVYPPDTITGTDFNDLANEQGVDAVKEVIESGYIPEIYSEKKVKTFEQSAIINTPVKILNDIIAFYDKTALKPQPLFGLAAGLLLGSVIFGRRYHTGIYGNYTSIFILVASSSGGGKDHVKGIVRKILKTNNLEQLERSGGYTAANTVIKSLERQPLQISFFEEFGQKIKEASFGKTNAKGVNRQLLDIWSSCHSESRGEEYSDGTIPCVINPALTMCGLSTPDTFYSSINEDLIEQGFVNRIIPFISDLPRTATPLIPNNRDVPQNIKDWLKKAWISEPPIQYNEKMTDVLETEKFYISNLDTDMVEVGIDEDVLLFFDEIEKIIVKKQEILKKQKLDDLLSRNREITIRISLILTVMAGNKTINLEIAQWSWSLIEYLFDLYVKKIKQNVSGSDFEKNKLDGLNHLKILAETKEKGIRSKDMAKTKPWSRWEIKLRQEILNELKEAGLADTIKIKTGKRGPNPLIWVALAKK